MTKEKDLMRMKEKVKGQEDHGPNYLRMLTVILVIILLITQVSVLRSLRAKFISENGSEAKEIDKGEPPDKTDSSYQSIKEMLDHLPPPELDEFNFRSEVVRPQEDMVEKFPRHPEMILAKLEKVVKAEAERYRQTNFRQILRF